MIFKGKYTVRSNGLTIAEKENIITTSGAQVIKNYLAGVGPRFSSFIAYGTGMTAALASDYRLQFEAGKAPVTLGAVVNGVMVYKAQIPEAESGRFGELALFAEDTSTYGSRVLSTFESAVDSISGGTDAPNQGRLGLTAYGVTATSAAPGQVVVTDYSVDLSDIGGTDEFTLAFFQNTGSTSTIVVRLMTDTTNYYTLTFTPSGSGYVTATALRSAMITTGAPDISNITRLEVTVNTGSTSDIYLDGFRVDRAVVQNEQKAVSRAVLSSIITKNAGQQMDIEYNLSVAVA